MQTWDAIRARRNVRQYTAQPIAHQDLERICEAGRRAPSSQNWQPWHFVILTGREQLTELAKAWERGAAGTSLARRRRSCWWPTNLTTSDTTTGCCMTSGRRPRS